MAFRILSTLLLAAGLVMAQRGGGGGSRNNPDSMGQGMARSRTEPLDQIAQMLKLNGDQKKHLKGIMDDAQKEAAPVRDEMLKSREEIGAAIEGGKSQDEIDKAVKSFAGKEAQMSTIEGQAFNKIFATLDADQKANSQSLIGTLMYMHGIFKRKNWNVLPTE